MRLTVVGCVLLPVPACENDPLEIVADAVEITADGASFYIQPDGAPARIPVAVQNTGDETIYVARCGETLSLLIDRWTGDQWERSAGDVCPAVYSSIPVELEADHIRWDTVAVADTGRYRMRLPLSLEPMAAARADAVSRPVNVRIPGDGPTTQSSPAGRR